MNYRPIFIFPNGDTIHFIDMNYGAAVFRIGELIVFESEKKTYRVEDIQHQIKRDRDLKYIQTLILLKVSK